MKKFTRYQTDPVDFGCDREEMLNKVVSVYSVALETETSVSMQASDADMVRFDSLHSCVHLAVNGNVLWCEYSGLL